MTEDGFYEVTDGENTYGYFLREDLAERCAARWEEDAPDDGHVHFYIWHHSFDDFYWA